MTIHDAGPRLGAERGADVVALVLLITAVLAVLAIPTTLLALAADWGRWWWPAVALAATIGSTTATANLIARVGSRAEARTVLGSSLGSLPSSPMVPHRRGHD